MTRWAKLMDAASDQEARARLMRARALEVRCLVEIGSGSGARCSADAWPKHEHRYEQEDFPK